MPNYAWRPTVCFLELVRKLIKQVLLNFTKNLLSWVHLRHFLPWRQYTSQLIQPELFIIMTKLQTKKHMLYSSLDSLWKRDYTKKDIGESRMLKSLWHIIKKQLNKMWAVLRRFLNLESFIRRVLKSRRTFNLQSENMKKRQLRDTCLRWMRWGVYFTMTLKTSHKLQSGSKKPLKKDVFEV